MPPSKKRSRVPGMTRCGGWRHVETLLHDKHGVVFGEGERVVFALPIPDDIRKSKKGADDAR